MQLISISKLVFERSLDTFLKSSSKRATLPTAFCKIKMYAIKEFIISFFNNLKTYKITKISSSGADM